MIHVEQELFTLPEPLSSRRYNTTTWYTWSKNCLPYRSPWVHAFITRLHDTRGARTAYPTEALEFTPVLSEVYVARSVVLCFMFFVNHLLSICPFSFDHCIVGPLIYCFWLPLRYLQTFVFKQLRSTIPSISTYIYVLWHYGNHYWSRDCIPF
jgi:hypothetical protein